MANENHDICGEETLTGGISLERETLTGMDPNMKESEENGVMGNE